MLKALFCAILCPKYYFHKPPRVRESRQAFSMSLTLEKSFSHENTPRVSGRLRRLYFLNAKFRTLFLRKVGNLFLTLEMKWRWVQLNDDSVLTVPREQFHVNCVSAARQATTQSFCFLGM